MVAQKLFIKYWWNSLQLDLASTADKWKDLQSIVGDGVVSLDHGFLLFRLKSVIFRLRKENIQLIMNTFFLCREKKNI